MHQKIFVAALVAYFAQALNMESHFETVLAQSDAEDVPN